ncbi:MAG: hypothetical protein ACLQEQ_08775 [Nitrososphaerales archaeon]
MKRETIIFLDLVLLVILFIVIGSSFFTSTPSREPTNLQPTSELTDPSGTYVFYNMTYTQNANNTTTLSYLMNLTSYQKIMHDPYTTQLTGEVQVVGNMVVITWTYPNLPVNPGGPSAQVRPWSNTIGIVKRATNE